MNIKSIIETYDCKVYTPELIRDKDILYGFCADLMSDALMIINSVEDDYILAHSMLITGLVTQQSIRTAEMLDIDIVLLVRGKIPSDKVVSLAYESNIALIATSFTMFNISGELYKEGIRGIKYNEQW